MSRGAVPVVHSAIRGLRCGAVLIVLMLPTVVAATKQKPSSDACTSGSFACFLRDLWPQAQERGVSRPVFDAAFADMVPDADVLAATRSQPEYVQPIGRYVVPRTSAGAASAGRQYAARWAADLGKVEQKFGVDPEIIVSVLALESGLGSPQGIGRRDVVRSLATLAHANYRGDFFRNELLFALRILQDGDVPRGRLVGSWAGAMGQPQFLPSSFVKFSVDMSGDGRRDIWTNVPDVLGSIGNYLVQFGWKSGRPWGYEVIIPPQYDFRFSRGTFSEWAARGLRRSDGVALAGDDQAYLLFPSGARGPAFLVTSNYEVIKQYNFSDPYALAVAYLADRMRGRPSWIGRWPGDDRPLSRDDRVLLQRSLAALCYEVVEFDGHITFEQRDMVRQVQMEMRTKPDGNPTAAVLDHIKTKAAHFECPPAP